MKTWSIKVYLRKSELLILVGQNPNVSIDPEMRVGKFPHDWVCDIVELRIDSLEFPLK